MVAQIKYEYLLHVWGGFWNKDNAEVHKEPEIHYKWFNTKEDRDRELERLKVIENNLIFSGFKNCTLAYSAWEGYLTRYKVIIQSHILYEGHIHIIENDLGYGFGMDGEFDCLGNNYDYMKEWKYDIIGNTEIIPDLDKAERLFTTIILR